MTHRQDCGLGRTGFSRSSSVRAWRRGQGCRGKARGPRSREAEEGRGKGATALSMSRSLPAICLSVCFLCLFPSIFLLSLPIFLSSFHPVSGCLSLSVFVTISLFPSISHCLSVCPSLTPCSLLSPNTSLIDLLCSSCWSPLLPTECNATRLRFSTYFLMDIVQAPRKVFGSW